MFLSVLWYVCLNISFGKKTHGVSRQTRSCVIIAQNFQANKKSNLEQPDHFFSFILGQEEKGLMNEVKLMPKPISSRHLQHNHHASTPLP